MTTIAEMRLYLMSRYPNSLIWHQKVQNMPTRQVVAIYNKFKDDHVPIKPIVPTEPKYHQIDMFEYLASLNQTRTEVKV